MHARSVGLIVSGAVFITLLTYGTVQAQELRSVAVTVAPAERPAVEPEASLVAVVFPPKRLGFERLRRVLPYGTVHNPITRYLAEEAQVVAQDD